MKLNQVLKRNSEIENYFSQIQEDPPAPICQSDLHTNLIANQILKLMIRMINSESERERCGWVGGDRATFNWPAAFACMYELHLANATLIKHAAAAVLQLSCIYATDIKRTTLFHHQSIKQKNKLEKKKEYK